MVNTLTSHTSNYPNGQLYYTTSGRRKQTLGCKFQTKAREGVRDVKKFFANLQPNEIACIAIGIAFSSLVVGAASLVLAIIRLL